MFVWLFLLNFGRGFKSLGRFILLTERMAVDMINWVIVFAVQVLGFAIAFEVLYVGKDSIPFGSVGIGWFTLTKWTLGEVRTPPHTHTHGPLPRTATTWPTHR